MNTLAKKIERIRVWFKKPEGKIFLITLFFHTCIILLINNGFIPIPAGPGDELRYHNFASQIAYHLTRGDFGNAIAIYPHHWYPLFLGVVYLIFGVYSFMGGFANALLISVCGVYLYKTMQLKKMPAKESFITTLLVINVYSSLLYLTSQTLKEAWILLLTTLILYSSAHLAGNKKFLWKYFLVFIISFLLLRNLRFFVSFACLMLFFFEWFINSALDQWKRIRRGVILLIIITAISACCTGWGIGRNMGIMQYIDPGFIQNLRESYYKNGSTTNHIAIATEKTISVSQESEGEIGTFNDDTAYSFSGKGIITSFSIVLLGPFPWQLPLKKYLITFLDLIVWYGVGILFIITLLKYPIRKIIPYCVGIGALLMGLTLGVDNLGAMLRYRLPVVIVASVYIPVAIEYLYKYSGSKNNIVST